MTNFVQSCSTLGGGAHPRFQAMEPAFCPKTIFHGHCYLPTEVVPIYLLTFTCFRTARSAGAGTSDGSSLRRMDLILRLLGLLTLQHRLLRFSPQRHQRPSGNSQQYKYINQRGNCHQLWSCCSVLIPGHMPVTQLDTQSGMQLATR